MSAIDTRHGVTQWHGSRQQQGRASGEPHAEVLSVSMLEVALVEQGGYQHPLDVAKKNAIVSHFDPDKVGVLMVSHRDGRYWVWDGYHRLTALRELGEQWVECLVYEELTIEREAMLFADQGDNRTPPSPLDLFLAACRAGKPEALGVRAALDGLGVQVVPQSRHLAPGSTSAIKTIRNVYAAGGPFHLSAVLHLAMTAWPDDPLQLSANVISALSRFMRLYQGHPCYSLADLQARLGSRSIARLAATATDLRSAAFGNSYHKAEWVGAILEAYNYRLRNRQLPIPTPSSWKRLALGQNPWPDA